MLPVFPWFRSQSPQTPGWWCSTAIAFCAVKPSESYSELTEKKKLYFTGSNSTLVFMLKEHGMTFPQPESVLFIDHSGSYTEAGAILEILKKCGMPLTARLIGLLAPKPLRNGLYRTIARNRYRWFGRTQQCFIPAPEDSGRFFLWKSRAPRIFTFYR